MALNLEDKKAIVEEVSLHAKQALSLVGADYRGLSVSEMTQLRSVARKSGVYVRVIRNTLARRAIEGTEFECAKDALVGPLVLAFSKDDPGAAARVFRDFSKTHEKLKVQLLSLGGQLLAANQLEAVANLPTYDQAISKLMSVMKAPVDKFVRTLAAPHTKLVRTFAAVAEQKKNVT